MKYLKEGEGYLYIKTFTNGAQQQYKKRPTFLEGEKVTRYTIYTFTEKDLLDYMKTIKDERINSNQWRALTQLVADELGMTVENIDTRNFSFRDGNGNGYQFNYYFGEHPGYIYDIYVLYTATDEPVTDKDLAYRKRIATKEHNEKMFDTFAKDNVKAILNKYGLMLLDYRGSIEVNSIKMNELFKEYLKNTMVKELAEIGVTVNLREEIISNYKFKTIAAKNQIKLNLGGKDEREEDK